MRASLRAASGNYARSQILYGFTDWILPRTRNRDAAQTTNGATGRLRAYLCGFVVVPEEKERMSIVAVFDVDGPVLLSIRR